MGRMHSGGKGKSRSVPPFKKSAPSWMSVPKQEVIDSIVKFARKGFKPSQIGMFLRDQLGVPKVQMSIGCKIIRILKANGLSPEIPEDLSQLIRKAVSMRKHLEKNKKDKDSKFRLIMVESRIHRLARYYRKEHKLPPTWKFNSATAATL